MSRTKDTAFQGIFKYLSKVEAEHASTVKRFLKCELPLPEKDKEVATDDDMENLKAAHEEKAATAFTGRLQKRRESRELKKHLQLFQK